MGICLHAQYSTSGGQKGASDLLELELHVVVGLFRLGNRTLEIKKSSKPS